MHKFFIISYKGANSLIIQETVKSMGAWFNNFDNQYIICTQKTLDEVKTLLDEKIIKGTDLLMIIETDLITVKGWLRPDSWDWIKNQKAKISK